MTDARCFVGATSRIVGLLLALATVVCALASAGGAAAAGTTLFPAAFYNYDRVIASAQSALTNTPRTPVPMGMAAATTPPSSSERAGSAALNAAKGGAASVRLGQAGEDAVRAAYEIGPKVRITVGGRGRVPDGLTDTTLSEVKNVASLSYTRQLRDFAAYARANNLRFDLYVRSGARLSGPLLDARAAGRINIREIP